MPATVNSLFGSENAHVCKLFTALRTSPSASSPNNFRDSEFVVMPIFLQIWVNLLTISSNDGACSVITQHLDYKGSITFET